ncbi:MAG: sugar phosphate isomerase/epimerase family protein [Candidatus Bathyarchaeia archaeon]
MSIEGFVKTCYELELDGVELTAYYLPSLEKDYLKRLKRTVFSYGLDVSSLAVGNNFCAPDEDERARQTALVLKWIDVAALMGAPCLRVFAGRVPEGQPEEEAFHWTVAALKECVGKAEEEGVILALENHGGITATPQAVIRLVEAVSSDWLRVTLDTGNFPADPYGGIEAVAPLAVNVHAKMYEVSLEGERRLDYRRILSTLRTAGYKGYLSIEYEGAEDPLEAVPRAVGFLKMLLSSYR